MSKDLAREKTHGVDHERSLIWSVRLFMTLAGIVFLAGIAIPIAFRLGGWDSKGFVNFLMVSSRADTIIMGRPPASIVAAEPSVVQMQLLYIDLAASLLLGLGVMLAALTWFGLRPAHRWAWWSVFVTVVVVAGSILRMAVPYVLRAPLGLADVPPIMWVLVVTPLPLVLGWRGTRADRPAPVDRT